MPQYKNIKPNEDRRQEFFYGHYIKENRNVANEDMKRNPPSSVTRNCSLKPQ
jgi:hypothetical protein